MATSAPGLSKTTLALSELPNADALLDIVERSIHSSRSEWLFFRKFRVGTARRNGNVQRLDGFAL
jgi:hypothetical protein